MLPPAACTCNRLQGTSKEMAICPSQGLGFMQRKHHCRLLRMEHGHSMFESLQAQDLLAQEPPEVSFILLMPCSFCIGIAMVCVVPYKLHLSITSIGRASRLLPGKEHAQALQIFRVVWTMGLSINMQVRASNQGPRYLCVREPG